MIHRWVPNTALLPAYGDGLKLEPGSAVLTEGLVLTQKALAATQGGTPVPSMHRKGRQRPAFLFGDRFAYPSPKDLMHTVRRNALAFRQTPRQFSNVALRKDSANPDLIMQGKTFHSFSSISTCFGFLSTLAG